MLYKTEIRVAGSLSPAPQKPEAYSIQVWSTTSWYLILFHYMFAGMWREYLISVTICYHFDLVD